MGDVGSQKWCSGVHDERSQAGVDDCEAISARLDMGVEHTVGWTSTVEADSRVGSRVQSRVRSWDGKHHSVCNETQIASFAT